MSLGLPEFGSRSRAGSHRTLWRAIRLSGLVALAYSIVIAAIEWRSDYVASASLEKGRVEAAQIGKTAEETKRSLQKNSDLLIATANVESSFEHVLGDLTRLLPEGVSLLGLKIEYTPEAAARLDFNVVARSPEAYDRFLSALSKSDHLSDIKPGAESRPGLVRATVTAVHTNRVIALRVIGR